MCCQAAFLLPILHKLLELGDSPNSMSSCAEPGAVIVAPTRELAIQIHNEARKFSLNSILRIVVCYGGASSASQYRQLQVCCFLLTSFTEIMNVQYFISARMYAITLIILLTGRMFSSGCNTRSAHGLP